MMRIFNRLFWLPLLVLSLVQSQSADFNFQRYIQTQETTGLLKNAQWSLYAIYADSKKPVIEHNIRFALAPASCLKLITTGAALKILGADYTFKTCVLTDGFIAPNGQIKGNIILKGGGDPTLGSAVVPGSLPLDSLFLSWVQALKQKGIRRIEGDIIADATLFDPHPIPDNWAWVDMGNYYGASSPALSIHDNLYYLIFKPSRTVGQPAAILATRPYISGLSFENHVLTGPAGSGDNAYIYCAPQQFKARVFGTVPAGVDSFTIKGSIPDPALFAAQYFLTFLQKNGINVTGKALTLKKPARTRRQILLAETTSPPLKKIIEQINKRSINLYCEMLVKAISIERGGNGNTKHGLNVIKKTLEDLKVNTEGLHLSDGSGLSRTNAITVRTMVEFLNAMRHDEQFTDYLHSLSLAGDPNDVGYFKKWGVGTKLAKNARLKSGLIESVRSHSGYLRDSSGRWIIFSFIANNFDGHFSAIDRIHESLLIQLSNLEN
ncbi:D-alanyl-D-alanine carboxypeptidase/D-alanyl-D-alanine endopeptidase [Caldithrix abyssi]|nr:D-alanyl-D-alanine carboxypeptidase/D-alanyl-D-alanine-endopeptidase [Caldithrix abyssi]